MIKKRRKRKKRSLIRRLKIYKAHKIPKIKIKNSKLYKNSR